MDKLLQEKAKSCYARLAEAVGLIDRYKQLERDMVDFEELCNACMVSPRDKTLAAEVEAEIDRLHKKVSRFISDAKSL